MQTTRFRGSRVPMTGSSLPNTGCGSQRLEFIIEFGTGNDSQQTDNKASQFDPGLLCQHERFETAKVRQRHGFRRGPLVAPARGSSAENVSVSEAGRGQFSPPHAAQIGGGR